MPVAINSEERKIFWKTHITFWVINTPFCAVHKLPVTDVLIC